MDSRYLILRLTATAAIISRIVSGRQTNEAIDELVSDETEAELKILPSLEGFAEFINAHIHSIPVPTSTNKGRSINRMMLEALKNASVSIKFIFTPESNDIVKNNVDKKRIPISIPLKTAGTMVLLFLYNCLAI